MVPMIYFLLAQLVLGVPDDIVVTVTSGIVTIGMSFTVRVELYNGGSLDVSSDVITLTVNTGTLSGTLTDSSNSDIRTFTGLTLNTLGSVTITATDSTTSLTDTVTFTVYRKALVLSDTSPASVTFI